MKPIALTDDQLAIIERLAEPLPTADRGRYLERVAELLADVEIGDRAVSRAARLAQSELWQALALDERPRNPSKWSRRVG